MRTTIFSCVMCLVAACGEVTSLALPPEAERADAAVSGRAQSATATGMPLPMKQRVIDSLSHSSADLVRERRPDGISRVDLRGRFHSVSFVGRDAAGRPQRRCSDDDATVELLLGEAAR